MSTARGCTHCKCFHLGEACCWCADNMEYMECWREEEDILDDDDISEVRHHMRQFGFVPKCYASVGGRWIMVYENPHGPMSSRYFVGLYEGNVEVLRHTYGSDLAARKDFERRVEAEC